MRRLLGPIGLLALLIVTIGADRPDAAGCKGGEPKTVEVGIARLVGCFETTDEDGDKVHTARFVDQPDGDVDLNGFFVASAYKGDGGILVDEREQSVTAVALDDSLRPVNVQLRSLNVPVSGRKTDLGGSTKLAFTAPSEGELLLDDLRLLSNSGWAKALAGFLPGNVEVPIRITEEGKGSMDLLLEATGALALKGKPQSATVRITTESGKGTQLDGFSFSVNEISFSDYLTLNNLSLYYSAADSEWSGDAEATWPFPRPGGKAGFKVGATLTDGRIRRVQVGANNLVIPVGTAGIITSLNGGFEAGAKSDDIKFNVGAGGSFGPPMWTPSGGVGDRPIGANATLTAGQSNGAKFVRVDGDISFMNIPLGDARVGIYFDAGIDLGARLGIGLPSVRNNENDPFYVGARVDGWVAGSGFQFDGSGRIALLGWRLADAQVLVNNRAIGTCVELFWFDVGGVYEWGGRVDTFGSSCGLARYRQKFPTAATSANGGRRMIRLDRNEALLRVTGKGDAPLFRLRSPDGQVIEPPATGAAVVRKDNAYFVNDLENETVVVPPRNKRRWEVIPLPGSPQITGFHAARILPSERVRARVTGRGLDRTLVWDSTGNPDTKLIFSEEMPGGREKQILTTDKARGRYRFRPAVHGNYGLRKLQVVVLHGGTPREVRKVATYRVKRPAKIPGPRKVRAWRNGTTIEVKWPRVRGASGYLVGVTVDRGDGRPVSVHRKVGPRRRLVKLPGFPSAGVATAKVFVLNAEGVAGRPGRARFHTGTRIDHLRPAAKKTLDSARPSGGTIAIRSVCPQINLHCRVELTLRFRGKVVARTSHQQAPDTFHRVKLKPRSPALRARIRRGRLHGFRVEVSLSRYGGRHAAKSPLT